MWCVHNSIRQKIILFLPHLTKQSGCGILLVSYDVKTYSLTVGSLFICSLFLSVLLYHICGIVYNGSSSVLKDVCRNHVKYLSILKKLREKIYSFSKFMKFIYWNLFFSSFINWSLLFVTSCQCTKKNNIHLHI